MKLYFLNFFLQKNFILFTHKLKYFLLIISEGYHEEKSGTRCLLYVFDPKKFYRMFGPGAFLSKKIKVLVSGDFY